MGLRADFTVFDLGYAESTEIMDIYIDYSEGCSAFVDTFLRVAKDVVPVDTGYLRSTLTATTDGEGICCQTLCDYAQYVEYGTVYMRAQPYFEPAIAEALAVAMPLWDMAVDIAQEEEDELLEEMEEEAERNSGRGGRQGGYRPAGGIFRGGFGGLLGLLLGSAIVGVINGFLSILSNPTQSRVGSFSRGSPVYGDGNISVEII